LAPWTPISRNCAPASRRVRFRLAKNVVLYKSTWTNPKPEVPVARLDVELKKPNTRPFVVAITADPVEE
jgi:hypothetical protein